ncbi:MAG: hypothetical protein EOP04_04270 [Proteobacteria bacterium]|nr:MAG: hypothetical protein EOP04_04270 [Pseudomonadota bacterium]
MKINEAEVRKHTDRIAKFLLDTSNDELFSLSVLSPGIGLDTNSVLAVLEQIDLENPENRVTRTIIRSNRDSEPRYVTIDKETFLRLLPRLKTMEAAIQRKSIRDVEAETGRHISDHLS